MLSGVSYFLPEHLLISILKICIKGQRNGLAGKNSCCSRRGPWVSSLYPHLVLGIWKPGDLVPSSSPHGHLHISGTHVYT